jgi:2-oxoglutarate ferredoxin oxidoreductase subunit gamma
MMLHEVIMAGFGGQGVLLCGQLVAHAGMEAGFNVTWYPSYGPEMRGGTCNCSVVVSDEVVGSPVVSEATALLVFNKPSLEKFESAVKTNGIILINSSLVDLTPKREDVQVYYVPANEIADGLGSTVVANMVMLGAFLEATGLLGDDVVEAALKEILPERRHHLLPMNMQAVSAGRDVVKANDN